MYKKEKKRLRKKEVGVGGLALEMRVYGRLGCEENGLAGWRRK